MKAELLKPFKAPMNVTKHSGINFYLLNYYNFNVATEFFLSIREKIKKGEPIQDVLGFMRKEGESDNFLIEKKPEEVKRRFPLFNKLYTKKSHTGKVDPESSIFVSSDHFLFEIDAEKTTLFEILTFLYTKGVANVDLFDVCEGDHKVGMEYFVICSMCAKEITK